MANDLTNYKKKQETPDGHEKHGRERWIIPYADLVTLLLALFVILYAAADRERARIIANSISAQFSDTIPNPDSNADKGVLPGGDSLLAEKNSLQKAFDSNQALRERARMTQNEKGIVISLAEAGFFNSGDAKVRDDALPLIDSITDSLRGSHALIRIEGHTDSAPISTPIYPSNWELSSARASAVLARIISRGVEPKRLSVAGYGDTNPIADNNTQEGRALNRRVDIVILKN